MSEGSPEVERIKKLNTQPGQPQPDDRKTCKHRDWNWNTHGRCCFNCGTFVVDFGD